jgi:DUF4097 and DUF4098 domain-containing protein YvlB
VLLFAAVAALAASGCSVQLDLDDDTTRRIENDVVPVASLTRLEVDTDNGAVEIVGGGVDEIEIRTVLEESNEGDAEYSIDTDGDSLVLRGECDGRAWNHCQVGFKVTVPDDVDVDVQTSNGKVMIDGLAGDVDVETDNGAIEGERLATAAVRARTDNGRIQLVFDESPTVVDATTDNGAIDVRLPDDGAAYDVDAQSDNGNVDVDVRTDPTAERTIVVESDNGAIDVEYRPS